MKLQIHPSIFREYDIRGIAEKEITTEFAYCLGRAYALQLKGVLSTQHPPTIAVGWDCRLTSDSYSAALVSGLREGGLQVVRLGVCPTPLTYFSIFSLNLDGGIMVTGSHNPADYNGFKICIGKGTLFGHQIQELRSLMERLNRSPEPISPIGSVSDFAIIPKYLDYLEKNAQPLKPMKIVIDAGNGTAGNVAPPLFTRLGAQVVPLFCELDGRFPNHHPDPTVPENLKHLVEKVKSEKAAFGLAFDGDSDRLGLVDESGRILFGDELMILLSRAVLKENPGATIISEVKSSHRLFNDIANKGGKPLMWKTGHSLIKSKMKETGALLAGEMSGHIFFADRYFGFDDAIYAALRVYEIASHHSEHPLSSLLSDLPATVSTPEIRVDCEEEKKFELVSRTKARLEKSLPVLEIDGVRVDFGDGWGLVRASNTQPVLVLRFEATTSTRLAEIRNVVETALKEASIEVGHKSISISSEPEYL